MMKRASVGSALLFLLSAAGLACGRVTLELPPAETGGVSGSGGATGAGGASGVGGSGGRGGASGTGGAAVDCFALDEMACRAHASSCRTDECPICGFTRFSRCSPFDAVKPICLIPPCVPPLPPCPLVASLDLCQVRPDCHSVFRDNSHLCDCITPGCCVTFAACADGDRALCSPPAPLCKSVAPFCGPGLALSYLNGCFEGCVAPKDCAGATPSPPP